MSTAANSSHSDPVIEFRNVEYESGGREILCALNLAIHRGEILVLLGRSGSGKTTALKLVNRLLTLSRGEIRVDSRDVKAWDVIKLRRHIGYAIQDVGLFPHYTVERNIGLLGIESAVPRLFPIESTFTQGTFVEVALKLFLV